MMSSRKVGQQGEGRSWDGVRMAKISSSKVMSVPGGTHVYVILRRWIEGGSLRRRPTKDTFENVSVEISRLSNRVDASRKDEKEAML
jgi:hypothetical protein